MENGKEPWALLLAGGDGFRLRSLTRELAGDERPKQFCRVMSGETLLEQTWRRALLTVHRANVMAVVTKRHERFYRSQLSTIEIPQVVSQPENRGTAPGILYPLLRLADLAPDASVAIFPSDHHVSDDRRFAGHVDRAFRAMEADPERVCGTASSWSAAFGAFLDLIRDCLPSLFDAFAALEPRIGGPGEAEAVAALYRRLASADFSHEVLAARPGALGVIPVWGVTWSDLGSPERVLRVRQQLEPRIRARASGWSASL